VVAWLAQIPSTDSGYGFLADMRLAVAGRVLAGTLAWVVIREIAGLLAMFGIGGVVAIVAIASQRRFWPPAEVRA
jgi:hypothetical protein